MRNADCGTNAEDSYESEEESSVRSNRRRSIPHSAIRNPHFSIRISPYFAER